MELVKEFLSSHSGIGAVQDKSHSCPQSTDKFRYTTGNLELPPCAVCMKAGR
jgi:hypothetical protein